MEKGGGKGMKVGRTGGDGKGGESSRLRELKLAQGGGRLELVGRSEAAARCLRCQRRARKRKVAKELYFLLLLLLLLIIPRSAAPAAPHGPSPHTYQAPPLCVPHCPPCARNASPPCTHAHTSSADTGFGRAGCLCCHGGRS